MRYFRHLVYNTYVKNFIHKFTRIRILQCFIYFLQLDSFAYKIFYKFRKSENSIIVDGRLYNDLHKGNNKFVIITHICKCFLEYIKDGDNVLDVSCGSGAYLKLLNEKRSSLYIEGWDISKDSINNYAKYAVPKGHFFIVDLEKKNKIMIYERRNKFDFIFCITTIQYLSISKIDKILKRFIEMLSDRGYFAVVFPFSSINMERGFMGFKCYHTSELKNICEIAGFKCIYSEDISSIFSWHYLMIFSR
jgi:ubiquinone/menaquinone biosynthesis C-methylase UbiE